LKRPRFKIFTFGCKVNQYDSQDIREKLLSAGLQEAEKDQPAGICIINSCTVTAKADRESLYQLRRCRRDYPDARIIVTGCVARKGAKIAGADLVVPNKEKSAIARLLTGKAAQPPAGESITFFKGHTRAFLKIQDGCDNFCAYCKVPFVRGRPVSKPLRAIIAEARSLVENGYKEIVLTGICLGKYGRDLIEGVDLTDVIEAIEPLPGLSRIRLSSIEYGDVTARLIGKLKENAKLCPHLHIPLQSGDDTVLKRMNRPYTSGQFKRLILKLKKTVADFTLTTDVMVGFPGESGDDFRQTLELVKALEPLKVHVFPFSPRPATKGAELPGQIPPAQAKERAGLLEEAAWEARSLVRKRFAGKRMEILVEGRAKPCKGGWQGYTRNYLEVVCRLKAGRANTLRMVRIEA
jgi:threonylcarbamoyladenosine tRNA methylthiotransferase MtaB